MMIMQDHTLSDKCSLCGKPYAVNDVVVQFFRWQAKSGEAGEQPDYQFGHLTCPSKAVS